MKNNVLIQKAVRRMSGAWVMTSLIRSFEPVVNTLMCAMFLDKRSLAVVGMMEGILCIFMLLNMFLERGLGVETGRSLGQGDKERLAKMYSTCMAILVGLAMIWTVLCLAFPEVVVTLGGAGGTEISGLCVLYVRSRALFFLPFAVGIVLRNVINGAGDILFMKVNSVAEVIGKLGMTVLLLLFTNLGIMSLGFGGVAAEVISLGIAVCFFKRLKLGLHFSFKNIEFRQVGNLIRTGTPDWSNALSERVMNIVLNTVLLRSAALGVGAVAVYSAVMSLSGLIRMGGMVCGLVSETFYAILYGMKDIKAIRRVTKSCLKTGFVITVVSCVIVAVFLPFLIPVFGRSLEPALLNELRVGLFLTMSALPFQIILEMQSGFFQISERYTLSSLNSIIADTVIYLILALLLTKSMGLLGLWISFPLAFAMYIIGFYIFLCIKRKKLVYKHDDFMLVRKEFLRESPKMDLSITGDNLSATGTSEKIQAFLLENGIEKRRAYIAALSLEELAADMIQHAFRKNKKKYGIDIKLLVDDDGNVTYCLWNDGARYNPFDFALDDNTYEKIGVKIVQDMADVTRYQFLISLNYVYVRV